jgi:hypothetical protein
MGPAESLPKSLGWLQSLANQLPMRRRFEVRAHVFQVGGSVVRTRAVDSLPAHVVIAFNVSGTLGAR